MPRLRSALQTAAWGVAQHSCPAFRQRRASSLELRSLASRLAVDEAAQQQLVCVARNTHGRGMAHWVRSLRTHSGEFVAMHRFLPPAGCGQVDAYPTWPAARFKRSTPTLSSSRSNR